MNKYIHIIISVFLLYSCSTKKKEVKCPILEIPEKIEPVNLSNITKNFETIKLETSEDCILAELKYIKFNEKLIYIQDIVFKGIYIYNTKGEFVGKFNKVGKGEGEYLSIDDFIIDGENNLLEILDRLSRKILIYDLNNFIFLESFSLPVDFIFTFSKVGDVYFFQTNSARNIIENKPTNSSIISYNRKAKKAYPIFDNLLDDNENATWEFNDVFTVSESEKLYASFAWDHIIYESNQNIMTPFLYIDAGNKKFPNEIINGNYDRKMDFLNSNRVSGRYHFFKLLMQKNQQYIIAYGNGYPPQIHYIMNLNNNKTLINTDNLINDYFPFKHEKIEIFMVSNGSIISVIYPFNTEPNSEIIKHLNVTTNSNPIILKFGINEK